MATRRQIIAEIVAEDKSKAVFERAQRKVRDYRGDIAKLNKELTEEEKDALAAAAAVKKLARAHQDAQPKVEGLKKGLEGIGISGEAMTSVYTLAGFALGKLAGQVIDFAKGSLQLAIDKSEEAKTSYENLNTSLENLRVTMVDVTLGTDNLSEHFDEMAIRVSAVDVALGDTKDTLGGLGDAYLRFAERLGPPFEALARFNLEAARTTPFLAIIDRLLDTRGGVEQLSQVAKLLESVERITLAGAGAASAASGLETAAARGAAAGKRRSRGRARGKKDGSKLTFGVDEAQIQQIDARLAREADRLRAIDDAGRLAQLSISRLGESFAAAFDQAEIERERILSLNAALVEFADGGIPMVTSALGDMFSQMAAGEFVMADFGAAFVGQFGSMLKMLGEGAIAAALIGDGIQKGLWISSPGAMLGLGAAALITGSLLEGFAKRSSNVMSGGSGAGGARAAADDAASTLGIVGGGPEAGPTETTLVIDGREVRGYVVSTVRQAQDTGELVPSTGDPL